MPKFNNFDEQPFDDFDEQQFSLFISFKKPEHSVLLESLLNETLMNFNKRFGKFDMFEMLEIDRLNMLWDSYQHVLAKDKYLEISYFTTFEHNQIFNFLCFTTADSEIDDEIDE